MNPQIGIVTALPKEYTAMKVMLTHRRDIVVPGDGAGREFCIGEIHSKKNEVHLIVLSLTKMGNNIAALRTSLMLEFFPTIKFIIMTGIAGGIPYPTKADDHVRLGDIVISDKKGVIQYDYCKEEDGIIEIRSSPVPPSATLLHSVSLLEAGRLEGKRPWEKFIQHGLKQLGWKRPSKKLDILYDRNDSSVIVPHPKDSSRIGVNPRVFIGPIASANTVLKYPQKRDMLRDQFGAKAVEMEGSGIADATWNHEKGYLVIRGICDYCDRYKNDIWQNYAAVVAASYTTALIESMPTQTGSKLNTIKMEEASHLEPSQLIPYNLPRPPELIGRDRDIKKIKDALSSLSWLVVIEGLGGIGKTALAEVIANELWMNKNFQLVIWSSAKGRNLAISNLLDEIIIAIDYPFISHLPLHKKRNEINKILRRISCLLVIDNFDTIVEEEKEAIFKWIVSLPNPSKILVTSRPPVPGEKLIPAGAFIHHLNGLNQSDSIALMTKKVKELGVTAIKPKKEYFLIDLYQITGGNPQAIILSIGQMKLTSYSLERIINNLQNGRDQLFQTLFSSSWTPLSKNAKSLLKSASVFSTSFTKAALMATQKMFQEEFESSFNELIRGQLVESNNALSEAELRFDLHPLTKAFAESALEKSIREKSRIYLALASFFLKFAKQYEVRFWEGREIYGPLEVERLNILSILDWCWENDQFELFSELSSAIADFLIVKGYWHLCLAYGRKAAKAAQKIGEKELQADIIVHMQGYLHTNRHEFEVAEKLLTEALSLYRQSNNQVGVSETLRNLARVYRKMSNFEIADDLYFKSYQLALKTGEKKLIALALNEMGKLKRDLGDMQRSMDLFNDAKEEVEDVDNSICAGILCNMAGVAISLGDLENAQRYSSESLQFFLSIDNKEGIATTKWRLAEINLLKKNKRAGIFAKEAYEIFNRLGMKKECAELQKLLLRVPVSESDEEI